MPLELAVDLTLLSVYPNSAPKEERKTGSGTRRRARNKHAQVSARQENRRGSETLPKMARCSHRMLAPQITNRQSRSAD